jgi:DNA recombination protein RmuC
MDWISTGVGLVIGGLVGGGLGYGLARRTAVRWQAAADAANRELAVLTARQEVELRAAAERQDLELRAATARLQSTQEAREQLTQAFSALSQEMLQRSQEDFLRLAQERFARLQEGAQGEWAKRQAAVTELLTPIRQTMEKVELGLRDLEGKRVEAYTGLREQVRGLMDSQLALQRETVSLSQALRSPNVRGRWGEMQLQRVLEFAGMTEHVDFGQQVTGGPGGDDPRVRPDVVVRLPNRRQIIVDAKAPLDAYLRALDAKDAAERERLMGEHARQIRDHLKTLGSKQYWKQFAETPEFVVMFLPGEVFFSAALERDPLLIEAGAADNVVLATPTTLIALLKAVAYGWKQEAIADEARRICELGLELHERIRVQAGHFADVGKALERSVEAFNKSARSLETRVLVTARRFSELSNKPDRPLPELTQIETVPQPPVVA